MHSRIQHPLPTEQQPTDDDLDRYTSYEQDTDLVICDRKNPQAWIKSDTTTTLDA